MRSGIITRGLGGRVSQEGEKNTMPRNNKAATDKKIIGIAFSVHDASVEENQPVRLFTICGSAIRADSDKPAPINSTEVSPS